MNGARGLTAAGSTMAVFGLVGLLLAGCSSSSTPRTNPKPPVPTFSATPRPPPTVAVGTTPPTACTGVAAAADIDKIVGHPLGGSANQVVGVPLTSIGRTARLDCYYGIPAGQPLTAALLTIGVATYSDPQSAQARITSTVNDARSTKSQITTLKVNGTPATLMVSQQNQALAMSVGTRTVLVTANTGVLPKGDDSTQLMALAKLGLTAHA
jgi:hypothetical protein